MKRLKEYFSHDYSSRQDEKILKMMSVLGWEGYGLYWGVVELLYQNEGSMQWDCDSIAFALQTNPETLKNLILNFNLFEIKNEKLSNCSVKRRIKKRLEKSEKAKQSALSRWNKKNNGDAFAMQSQCDSNAIKEKKSKVNKSIEEKRKKKKFTPPSLLEIQEYITLKNYSVNAEKFLNFYESKGWMVGKNKMTNWKAAVGNWASDAKQKTNGQSQDLVRV